MDELLQILSVLPLALAYLTGIVIAFRRRREYPRVSRVVILVCTAVLVVMVGQTVFYYAAFPWLATVWPTAKWDNLFALVNGVTNLVLAGCVGLGLWAVYMDRDPNQFPDEE
jgi:ABC-type dipeptide/oligopeptide/nickel transport system permease component